MPNYPPADDLQAHIAAAAARSATSLYTDILGLEPLRAAFAQHLRTDYCGDVRLEDVAITAGGNQAFCLALMALAQPGDNVIIPSPFFFNHQMWCDMQGIEVRPVRCHPETGMLPDGDEAAGLIDNRTRAMVLVSPNNPTGAIYPPDLIETFYELCAGHGLALLIDETYKDFRGTGASAHGLFGLSEWRDTFIHLHSFSKSYALTGYRVGGLAASPQLVGHIEKLMDCVAICAPHIAQLAALYGLENLTAWRQQKAAEMAAKQAALGAAFNDRRLDYRMISAGAFFAYVRHPFEERGCKEVARTLAGEHGLLVLPGSMFGEGQKRYLRIAFANADITDMPEIVGRLIASQP